MRALFRLVRDILGAFRDSRVRGLVATAFSMILAASVFYRYVEGWSWLDSVYFSVITISTVGYGDFSPQTAAGKIFTIGYILCGLGVFVAAATSLAERLISARRDREE